MNRNLKHPGKTYRRKANTGDRTRNSRAWRITASWDARPDRPAVRTTTDRKARDRMAVEFAAQGGYVIVEEARGFEWRTIREVDGSALVAAADHAAAERDRAEATARAKRHNADYAVQAARNALAAHLDGTADRDRLAALMRQTPTPRDQRARHTAGGR
ncbi:hypothetical protein [Streptomyces sp. NBC_01217]|uniref:hypothetical protein n=1 Tax=Streptomyces sp. NBC_01217 TaxID=2903779 RepID=UPI002E1285EA|nr:hypothetical protein OG507_21090 [Streptomyces sp. NBC_01217]